MRVTYDMATAITLFALIPTWLPSLAGWGFTEPRSVLSFTIAILMIGLPVLYEKWGPGFKV